jgi:hypothetical protein
MKLWAHVLHFAVECSYFEIIWNLGIVIWDLDLVHETAGEPILSEILSGEKSGWLIGMRSV